MEDIVSDRPYREKMFCPIRNIEEEVFFYEVNINGKWYLEFKGCDHQFHACDECENCRKEAYQKVISRNK